MICELGSYAIAKGFIRQDLMQPPLVVFCLGRHGSCLWCDLPRPALCKAGRKARGPLRVQATSMEVDQAAQNGQPSSRSVMCTCVRA